jgi:dolichol-phosphate mannosyltransferase
MNNQIVIAIPTYNEIDNIHLICSRVFAAIPEATLWFIDDNSPDGTGRHLDVLADNDHRIQVFHRAGKLGVGSAHIHAIHLAYELSIDTLVTMDADLTHSPERINEMMHLLQESNAAVVLTSRFMAQGGLAGWTITRRTMTHLGHLLTRTLLLLPYDASGAFRAYNLSKIPRECFTITKSTGYSFFYESLKIFVLNNLKIAEMSITLPARTQGHSKMKMSDIFHSLAYMVKLAWSTLTNKKRFIVSTSELNT